MKAHISPPIWRAVRVLASVAAVAALSGCAHMMAGQAVYASETASAASRSVKMVDLPKLIPTLPELSAAVNSAQLTKTGTVTGIEPLPENFILSEPNCVSVMSPGLESTYRGSGYLGAYGLAANGGVVDAVAVAFLSAKAADRLADAQTDKWKRCTDKTFTANVGDQPPVNWIVSGPTRSYGVAVLLRIQEGGGGFACARGMAARANVVADVLICNPDQAVVEHQASRVVNMILDKIPE